MNKQKWVNPVQKLAERLVDLIRPEERAQNRMLNEQILLLESGRRQAVREYYVRKYTRILTAILLLLALLCAALLHAFWERGQLRTKRLARPGYRQGSSQEQMLAYAGEEMETELLDIVLQQRTYSQAQARQLVQQAKAEYEEKLLGENPSADEVRENLYLPESLAGGAVQLSYVMVPYGIIDSTGRIVGQVGEQGTVVEIQARLTCQEQELLAECAVRVLPRKLSEKEAFWHSVQEEVEQADAEQSSEAYLELPDHVDGRAIRWKRPAGPWVKLALLLLLVFPAGLWAAADQRIREKAQKRRMQMQLDYGDLMWKMTMLLGAGLTVRGTFLRIAKEYTQKGREKRYAYEEVVRCCREMKSGMAEDQAYERFGRRCDLPEYIRLGSMLAQNVKKGAKGLAAMLRKEAEVSLEQRQSMARKRGEQAGTKLLLPMILMLGIVMVILMMPAFITF